MTRLSIGPLPLLLAYMLVLCTNAVPQSSLTSFKPVSGVDRLFECPKAQDFEFGGNFSFPQLEKQISITCATEIMFTQKCDVNQFK